MAKSTPSANYICLPTESFLLRFGLALVAASRRRSGATAQPERRCQGQTEAGRDCGPFPSVRDECVLQGCITRVGRGLAPKAFAFQISRRSEIN